VYCFGGGVEYALEGPEKLLMFQNFEQSSHGSGRLTWLDPCLVTLAILAAIIGLSVLPIAAWRAFAASALLLYALCWLAQVPLALVLRRSLLALPFVAAAITLPFTRPGNVIASFWLGPWHLQISDTGVVQFASIVLRSWLSVQFACVLLLMLGFPQVLQSLRRLRVPALLIAVMSMSYRYLSVLADEATRMLQARAARSALAVNAKAPSLWWQAKQAGQMVGHLFIRSYERSERIYLAMLARGYSGQLPASPQRPIRIHEWCSLAAFLIVLLLIQLLGYAETQGML
jgi:cobalt/nickel transport system permease protein